MKTMDQKRQEAKERDEAAKNRTPEEQLRRLDEKFGVGVGAKRERDRLQSMIDEKQVRKTIEKEEREERKKRKETMKKERLELERAKAQRIKESESTKEEEEVEHTGSSKPRKMRRSMKKKRKTT